MLTEFFRRILEGYLAPRASVRRLIDAGHGLQQALLMVLLGYLVSFILLSLVPGAVPEEESRIALHIRGLINQAILFFLLSALVFWLGRLSGGVGTRIQSYVTIGWHSLVTSFLTPLPAAFVMSLPRPETPEEAQAMAEQGISGNLFALALIATAVWFWLLAQYVAELHRFQNAWGVLGVIVGLPFAIGMFLMVVLGSVATQ